MACVDAEIQRALEEPIQTRPSYSLTASFLWLGLLLTYSSVRAQENIGYYVKIAQDSTSITWQKVWGTTSQRWKNTK